MHSTILSSALTFGDQNNPNLPFQSILTSLLPLPALPPPPLLPVPLPPAPACVCVCGLMGAIALTNCPPAQFQLNIIYGHCFFFFFFYKCFFIGLGLCLLMTVTVLEWLTVLRVHCHISSSSLSPDTEARGGNSLFTVNDALTATFLSSCQWYTALTVQLNLREAKNYSLALNMI